MREPIEEVPWYAYPSMVAVVTARHGNKQNIMASGWHTYIGSSPGVYGIAIRKETYTYQLIEQSGVFGVQFLPAHASELIQAVGTFSGHDTDKFATLNIKYEEGLKANIPVLSEAYFAYECRVISMTTFGDHEWVAGQILQCYKDKQVFSDNGMIDLSKLEIPLYMGRSVYRVLDANSNEKDHPIYLQR